MHNIKIRSIRTAGLPHTLKVHVCLHPRSRYTSHTYLTHKSSLQFYNDPQGQKMSSVVMGVYGGGSGRNLGPNWLGGEFPPTLLQSTISLLHPDAFSAFSMLQNAFAVGAPLRTTLDVELLQRSPDRLAGGEGACCPRPQTPPLSRSSASYFGPPTSGCSFGDD